MDGAPLGHRWSESGTQPVFNLQPLDPLEFSNVVCDENSVQSENLDGDQEIVAADLRAGLFQLGADSAIVPICFRFKRKNLNSIEQLIYACGQNRRTAFCYAVTEFSRNDDGR